MLLIHSREKLIDAIAELKVVLREISLSNGDCDESEELEERIAKMEGKLLIVNREIKLAYGKEFYAELNN